MALDQPRNIYVSGLMTDGGRLPIGDARERFAKGAAEVRALGYNPVTPFDVAKAEMIPEIDEEGHDPTQHSWVAYMKANIRTLLECDGIYLLEGWWDSKGSRIEENIAQGLDLLVLYQDNTVLVHK